jgi:hypothetical protein
MVCFHTKIPIWGNFGGPNVGKCWYILWPFGLFYGNLVLLVVIWYIFCMLLQEKSGNPGKKSRSDWFERFKLGLLSDESGFKALLQGAML